MSETTLDTPTTPARNLDRVVPPSDLDTLLTAQIAVAWAGERGEQPRLRWWDSDLTSEMGGEDLFQQLLPVTWQWATLQAARAAAQRYDAVLRARDHAPDTILTLFSQGFTIDELTEERLQVLKRSGVPPASALPGLTDLIQAQWNRARVIDWLDSFGAVDTAPTPIGRLIKGPVPEGLDQRVRKLLGALNPLADTYPLPHYRRPE
ncbi:BREX-6 system BrxE protein [Thiocapsa sp.]|uniref:BREX-6 system BrxE protein n=1 Tax=Thiocapsa sp. TaxID=2024551 RepID=UPI003593D2A1